MRLAWVGRGGSLVCCASSCFGCFALGFAVVVPVAEGTNHVCGGCFAWLPLVDVCCFEACGFGASLPVALCLCAAVAVAL